MNELLKDILINVLLAAAPLFLWILPYALLAVYLERKVSAFMQDRLGPMRVGKYGLLQTIADILKLLQKEDITADAVDKKLFNFAPVLVFIGSYAAFAAIPFSSIYIGSNIDLGIFYILAVSSLVVAGLLLGAWASNNKYSLYGGLRTAAQIVSYEIPTAIVVLSLVIVAGTLNLKEMSEAQTANIFNWYIFGGPELSLKKFILIPFLLVAAVIYFISSLAEVNRTPFDIPEAESEIIGGYHTEYSGMKFAFFFLAEYANMFAVSAVITVLFFGGYQSPFGYLGNLLNMPWLIGLEQIFWFLFKGMLFVFVQMWLRWTLPRLRVDQLMALCWRYLIPISLVNLVIIAFISLL
ncbi:MAG TPA: NADH-quinone oxidoreductase subunit NuoH [Ignavibacteriales bacterium]|nr:NADH-quinone oxidoreductase subunit NuoH [Ignavibacteriales bacterium]HOL82310.1 NADH-quinone oxidoreductase subunit NuoH [Ignavibacteriales bacterium]HOM66339.1 NADH-quinone oxidoreductase subunit NuoH [Ignavibacteriales bacterium]HPP34523.1 NADH-quinone oxidoreductase subunit NuoH [Ignavibacteriales bacterium]HRR19683.1 NADH-quinone oxidoreductase subunit NuoH [Ignavibacteriales bacterium]